MGDLLVPPAPRNVVQCPCCGADQPDVDFLADAGTSTISTRLGQVRISPKEFAFAVFLLERAPTLVSKAAIYERVFMNADGGGPDAKIVDVVACRVRAALAAIGFEVVTEWGAGLRVAAVGPDGVRDPHYVMRRPRGPQQRWTPAMDDQLRDLLHRGYKPAQIAAVMKKPYGAIERAIKRLSLGGI
jgi:Transcriptional regulatory protein, C terminal